ncbi:NYN domain-containing protein [Roseospirillum parvum]|uniref:Uncharacterized conserved protein, LabA/DUF88 family n=1 Tax=Roseospirillum parvum TaxID=83401 RepID=A0A1G7YM03_9PROT|nr:NYN domain-containing protein [Roseospirillum parvum]SDG97582.1 Uncharacterized conserved protein, LabA/DUF88 family [Roseospirillum parvum]
MRFYDQERLALFIDGANLYAAARTLGFDIDYKNLLQHFASQGRLIRAFYYTALADEQEYSPIRPLIDWLDYNGYTMVTKPIKEFTDSTGRRKVKGNMDIELAIDAMEMAAHVDHVVLFSGDGDFRRLVEALQRLGRRVTVISSIRTQPPMVADELRRQADIFLDLRDLEPVIARASRGDSRGDRRPPPRPAPTSGTDDAEYEDDEDFDDYEDEYDDDLDPDEDEDVDDEDFDDDEDEEEDDAPPPRRR